MATDAVLKILPGKEYYDISFDEKGDILTDQSLDTAILKSIFDEARASESEIPESTLRRGWLGTLFAPSASHGSKQWTFEQERATGSIFAELGVVIRNSLQWLIDDKIAVNVIVGTPFLRNNRVVVEIALFRSQSKVEKKVYDLWNNTGSNI